MRYLTSTVNGTVTRSPQLHIHICSHWQQKTCARSYVQQVVKQSSKGEGKAIPKQLYTKRKVIEDHCKDHAAARVISSIRQNELGVQLLSRRIHSQIFKNVSFPIPDPSYVRIAREHLKMHSLDPADGAVLPNIDFTLPQLQGSNLAEHFYRIGSHVAEPWLSLAKSFASQKLHPKPYDWHIQSGWTKYCHREDGSSYCHHVPFPSHNGKPEEMLVFDVETMPKYHPYAVMACAASPNGWYTWISPWLLDETPDPLQLIPMGKHDAPRIIIGHNVSYDRARIAEEYCLLPTKIRFLDTMALHVAVKGISSHQRPTWLKYRKSKQKEERQQKEAAAVVDGLIESETDDVKKEELRRLRQDCEDNLCCLPGGIDSDATEADLSSKRWEEFTSANSLADVAKLHCNIVLNKATRDDFTNSTPAEIRDQVVDYLTYCATDVDVTHQVFSSVLPIFLGACSHPISFAGILTMGSSFLPVNQKWERYLEQAESVYQEMETSIRTKLRHLAEDAKELKEEQWENDPWLNQLDWTPKIAGKSRGVISTDFSAIELRDTEKRKLETFQSLKKIPRSKVVKPPPVYWPKWYWDAAKPKKNKPPGTLDITVRNRIAPLLLRLSWLGWPLFYSREHGWIFRVPSKEDFVTRSFPLKFFDPSDDSLAESALKEGFVFYKLPHKDGEKANVGSPLGKTFIKYAQDGTLKSPGDEAKDALEMSATCSYWISARDRIQNQMAVWQSKNIDMGFSVSSHEAQDKWGIILPQVITMGTVTRRAIEKTWLTASNAKKNRVGSELKAMVHAPDGYAIVGADVDSEELWISSCMGDAQFGIHGATAIGWMTLEGTKSSGTDLHSKTAKILGISRDQAKVFNYSRIYGAGMRHAVLLLLQSNASMLPDRAQKLAENLYASTKGKNTHKTTTFDRKFWFGGSESYVFNKLEEIASSNRPQTPALGCGVTDALSKEYLPTEFGANYMTSRINWVVQSSGVDYLHLLIASMEYLIAKYDIKARYLISVHDELRYLVRDDDKYRAGLALQVANVWTRSLFAYMLGMDDLPQGVAFFSSVDFDHILRKEVDMPCVTPSQPIPIPSGEKLDISELLIKTKGGSLWKDGRRMMIETEDDSIGHLQGYIEPNCLKHRTPDIYFLRAQATDDFGEVKGLAKKAAGKRSSISNT